MDQIHRISELIIKYRKKAITAEEQQELDEWLEQSEDNKKLFNRLTDSAYIKHLQSIDKQAEWNKIMRAYHAKTGEPVEDLMYKREKRSFRVPAIAAAALAVAMAIWLLWPSTKKSTVPAVAQHQEQQIRILPNAADMVNSTSHTILRLPNSSVIILDSIQPGQEVIFEEGSIIKRGPIDVEIKARSVPYQQSASPAYYTINTPRQALFNVMLSDGTRASLNANTTLRFPVVYRQDVRQLAVVGEADFEVSKLLRSNRRVPLEVHTHASTLNVLGTHFNLAAYPRDSIIKTTLVEGSVEIITKKDTSILKPGEEASVNKKGQVKIGQAKNLAAATAWKTGVIEFQKSPLDSIMNQASRWYDVQVECSEELRTERFTITLKIDQPLDVFLQKLEETGVKFETSPHKILAKLP